jgi:hypothetical protein
MFLIGSFDLTRIFLRVPFPDIEHSCATPQAARNKHHRLAKAAGCRKVKRQFEQNSAERRNALATECYE